MSARSHRWVKRAPNGAAPRATESTSAWVQGSGGAAGGFALDGGLVVAGGGSTRGGAGLLRVQADDASNAAMATQWRTTGRYYRGDPDRPRADRHHLEALVSPRTVQLHHSPRAVDATQSHLASRRRLGIITSRTGLQSLRSNGATGGCVAARPTRGGHGGAGSGGPKCVMATTVDSPTRPGGYCGCTSATDCTATGSRTQCQSASSKKRCCAPTSATCATATDCCSGVCAIGTCG